MIFYIFTDNSLKSNEKMTKVINQTMKKYLNQ